MHHQPTNKLIIRRIKKELFQKNNKSYKGVISTIELFKKKVKYN